MNPNKQEIVSPVAPLPAGTYAQAVRAGDYVFTSGQTARTRNGGVAEGSSPEDQCRQALTNLAAVAEAAGGSLDDAVKVTVYLGDFSWKAAFDAVYGEFVTGAARSTVRALPPSGQVEVDAILYIPQ